MMEPGTGSGVSGQGWFKAIRAMELQIVWWDKGKAEKPVFQVCDLGERCLREIGMKTGLKILSP